MVILNVFYNIFKQISTGFSAAIFHTQIVDGHLIWQFSWGGIWATFIMCILIVSAVIWLFVLIMKINRKNAARQLGNGGEVANHVAYFLGIPAFIFVSPFIMMAGGALVELLTGIFGTNTILSLSDQDVKNINELLIPQVSLFGNFTSQVNLTINSSTYSLIDAISKLSTQLTNAYNSAVNAGNSAVAETINNQLKQVNELLTYLNNDFGTYTNNLMELLRQIKGNTIDPTLANEIANDYAHISRAYSLVEQFNNSLMSDLIPYKDIIIGYDPAYNYIFDFIQPWKDSMNNQELAINNLAYYFESQNGVFAHICNGGDNYLGISTINNCLTGTCSFSICQILSEFITGSKGPWQTTLIYGSFQAGTEKTIIGTVCLYLAVGSMWYGLWKVARLWVITIISWITAIPSIASGENKVIKKDLMKILSSWFEIFFIYCFFEVGMNIVSLIANAYKTDNIYIAGAGLLLVDAVMFVAIKHAGVVANNLFFKEDGDYYAQGANKTRGATDPIKKTTKSVVKITKKAVVGV